MKKTFLIFSIVLLAGSLTAIGFFDWKSNDQIESSSSIEIEEVNNPDTIDDSESLVDFLYDVDNRFFATVTKEGLRTLESITPFIRETKVPNIVSYESVEISIWDEQGKSEVSASGTSEMLNDSQLELLRSFDYATNFVIRADYNIRYQSGDIVEDYSTPHITVVPEKQTEYIEGKDALLDYLRESTKNQMGLIQENKIRAGKIYFTVSQFGFISDVLLSSSCGYPTIDMSIMDLIQKTPGQWQPAENAAGQMVDQTLVVSFGMVGC